MPSGKQRRVEIKAARRIRAKKRKQALLATQSPATNSFSGSGHCVPVNPFRLAANVSYSTPDFMLRGYYLDISFRCADCGVACVWTAQRQKWWYETMKGGVWTTARRCAACRARKRAQRELGRKTFIEGMARKASRRQP